MSESSTFGTVTDCETREPIRPATADEWRKTADDVNSTEGQRKLPIGVWDDNGREVSVHGGPELRVSNRDIAELRKEAMRAGDAVQDALCVIALGDWDDDKQEAARLECASIILDARMRVAEDA